MVSNFNSNYKNIRLGWFSEKNAASDTEGGVEMDPMKRKLEPVSDEFLSRVKKVLSEKEYGFVVDVLDKDLKKAQAERAEGTGVDAQKEYFKVVEAFETIVADQEAQKGG